ncbi:hypothetical protein NP493_524g00012 [Ridgeia piscesae]|uniref:Uncharacterized protein n=1 Tax=Ridgeia piscesae TaxID=27915 RepID=A0AAD9NQN8_RIDPI|nr:hypothetical protein NP493_524g00012 [Ridgeia piscesae]
MTHYKMINYQCMLIQVQVFTRLDVVVSCTCRCLVYKLYMSVVSLIVRVLHTRLQFLRDVSYFHFLISMAATLLSLLCSQIYNHFLRCKGVNALCKNSFVTDNQSRGMVVAFCYFCYSGADVCIIA